MIRSYFGIPRQSFAIDEDAPLLEHQQRHFDTLKVHSQQGGFCLILGEPDILAADHCVRLAFKVSRPSALKEPTGAGNPVGRVAAGHRKTGPPAARLRRLVAPLLSGGAGRRAQALWKIRAPWKYLLAKFFPVSISNPVSQPFGLLSD